MVSINPFNFDFVSSDDLDFGSNEVYPGDASAHQFYGYPRNAEVPPPPVEEAVISE